MQTEADIPYRTLRCEWIMRLASSGVKSLMDAVPSGGSNASSMTRNGNLGKKCYE